MHTPHQKQNHQKIRHTEIMIIKKNHNAIVTRVERAHIGTIKISSFDTQCEQ